jgi:hypothetical protein
MLSHRFVAFPRRFRVCAAQALLFLCCGAARAQVAGLSGIITDPAGEVVSGAKIIARNDATAVSRETLSTGAGLYDVLGLTPGTYAVRVVKSGFQTAEQVGITIRVSTVTRLDMQLKLGDASQRVQVTAEDPILQTNNASSATEISGQKYDDLALVQQGRIRSPMPFINLAPGVQGNYKLTGAEETSATNYIEVDGSQSQTTEIYLDGVQAGRSRPLREGSFNENAPPVDAIQEFKVITTLLPADYGKSGSAVGTFSMKSGTNKLHGSIYEYFRNSALDAEPWGTVTPLFTHQNEFGTTLGGPVVLPHVYNGRNRTFFFFSYGGSRKTGVDALQLLKIPTAAEIAGNFAGANTIYNPLTTTLSANGSYVRTPFPGNAIPASMIDPVAKAIARYYPAPNLTGSNNYSTFNGEELLDIDAEAARIDHKIDEKNRVSGEFVFTYIPRHVISTGLPAPLVGGQNQPARTNTGQMHWQWIPSSKAVNELSLALNRYVSPSAPVDNSAIAPSAIGLSGLNSTAPPSITFTNGYAPVATNTLQYQVENTYILRDVLYLTAGQHQFRFGGEFRDSEYNDLTPTPASSSLAFSNLETDSPTAQGSTGDAFASFLLGNVNSASLTVPLEIATRQHYTGFFAQDDWKVLPSLTLNLGMRFEFQGLPYENQQHNSIISLSTPNPLAGNLPGAVIYAGSGAGRTGQSVLGSPDYNGFGPRFGFAWAATPRTVLRGGYGIYYSDVGLTLVTAGFQPQATFSSPNGGLAPAFVLANGFPQSATLVPAQTPGLLNGQSGSFLAPNADAMPRIQEWSLTVQHSLSKNLSVEASYVGNHGTGLLDPQLSNINQVNPKYLSLGSLLTQSVTSAAAVAAGIVPPYPGFSGTVAQALRPYPQYMTLTSVGAKNGASKYNALQIVVKKRFSSGFSVDGNYTFSRSIGYNNPAAEDGGTNNILQNAYNTAAEWSLLPTDVRNAVTLNWIYELPFGQGRRYLNANAFERVVFGNWSVSAIQRYQSGFPLSIVANNTLPIFNSVLRPNIVPGVDPATGLSVSGFNPSINRVINPAAFSEPAPYTFGNAAPTYNNLRNFPILNEDLSLIRGFHIGEHVNAHLYGQFFNALNRHRFTSIDTNFNDAAFGQPSGVSQPRLIQLGVRFQY